jgi:hypothetical protein
LIFHIVFMFMCLMVGNEIDAGCSGEPGWRNPCLFKVLWFHLTFAARCKRTAPKE